MVGSDEEAGIAKETAAGGAGRHIGGDYASQGELPSRLS